MQVRPGVACLTELSNGKAECVLAERGPNALLGNEQQSVDFGMPDIIAGLHL